MIWIRSQGRKLLTQCNGVKITTDHFFKETIGVEDGCIVLLYNGEELLGGYYATRERALEVLDEIQAFINKPELDTATLQTEYINGQVYYLTSAKANELRRPNVFEMPSE